MRVSIALLPMILVSLSVVEGGAQVSRLEGRLDPQTRAVVATVVDSARGAGLPAEPLVDKALEGASKGASGPRIVAAVRSLARELGVARSALGPAVSSAELVAGAGAVRAGVSPAILARLRAERAGGSIAMELIVIADLIARGVPADTAAALVSQLAAREAGTAALAELRRDVARDIDEGVPPAVAAVLRTRGVLVAAPLVRPATGDELAESGPTRGTKP